jgi:plasmid stabilization system protein ParE
MSRYVLTPAAVIDLVELRAFIARENPDAAAAVARRLIETFRRIADRPSIGRATHRTDVREWSVPGLPYVVPYRLRDGRVEVLRVFHTRRNRPDQW